MSCSVNPVLLTLVLRIVLGTNSVLFKMEQFISWLPSGHLAVSFFPSDGSYVRAQSLQLCPALCYTLACSPPGSSVHGNLQARILEWVALPSSIGSSRLRDQTHSSCIAGRCFTAEHQGSQVAVLVSVK